MLYSIRKACMGSTLEADGGQFGLPFYIAGFCGSRKHSMKTATAEVRNERLTIGLDLATDDAEQPHSHRTV